LVNVLVPEWILEDAAKEMGSLPGYHPLFTFEFTRWERQGFSERLHLEPAELRKVAGWLEDLEREALHEGEAAYSLSRAWLMLLIGFLSRCYGRKANSPQLDMRLGRVLASIDRYPMAAVPLRRLAHEAGMSERSFLRYFKKATGFSPADYRIRQRIRRAEELLLAEGRHLPITEVAFRCGFNDSNYFARQFRRVMGKSPREYRG
jgi:AraC-like DNA-binding protein